MIVLPSDSFLLDKNNTNVTEEHDQEQSNNHDDSIMSQKGPFTGTNLDTDKDNLYQNSISYDTSKPMTQNESRICKFEMKTNISKNQGKKKQ